MSIGAKKYTSHKEDLENIFGSFINAKDDKSFFLGIYDYVGYIIKNKKIYHFLIPLEREKNEKSIELRKFRKIFKRDLLSAERKLFKAINKDKKIREQLKNQIERLKLIKRFEKIEDSPSNLNLRYKTLTEMLEILHNQKFGEDLNLKNFSRYYADFILEIEDNEKLKEISLWGCWEKLKEVYSTLLIMEGKQHRNKSEKFMNPKIILALDVITQNQRQKQIKKQEYGRAVNRVHNYLINNLGIIEKNSNESAESLNLPDNARWEDIEIKFINQYDVQIYFGGKYLKATSYEKMGFADQKNKDRDPDKQWNFLQRLSLPDSKISLEEIGKYSGNERMARIRENDRIKSQKKILSKKLQKYFGLKDDCFSKYVDKGYYEPRFRLLPEPSLRGGGFLYGEVPDIVRYQ